MPPKKDKLKSIIKADEPRAAATKKNKINSKFKADEPSAVAEKEHIINKMHNADDEPSAAADLDAKLCDRCKVTRARTAKVFRGVSEVLA